MIQKSEFENSVEFDLFSSEFGQELFDNYKIDSLLYKSNQSEIYIMTSLNDNKHYTLKAITKKKGVTFHIDTILNLSHPLIAPVITIGETSNFVYIIKPYIEGITLKTHIDTYGTMTETIVKIIAQQLVAIFHYLNSKPIPIVYRDLKPENIIIYGNFNICLIDIESIRLVSPVNNTDTFYIGTSGYASPEQFGFCQTDVRSDIYTIGATLFYLLTGQSPSLRSIEQSNIDSLHKVNYLGRNNTLLKVINRCMEFNPADRYQTVHQLEQALFNKNSFFIFTPFKATVLSLMTLSCILLIVYTGSILSGLGRSPIPSTLTQTTSITDEGYEQKEQDTLSAPDLFVDINVLDNHEPLNETSLSENTLTVKNEMNTLKKEAKQEPSGLKPDKIKEITTEIASNTMTIPSSAAIVSDASHNTLIPSPAQVIEEESTSTTVNSSPPSPADATITSADASNDTSAVTATDTSNDLSANTSSDTSSDTASALISTETEGILFPDPEFERCIRDLLKKPNGSIVLDDMLRITQLDYDYTRSYKVTNLEGIQYCKYLFEVGFLSGSVSDLTPLSSLTELKFIILPNHRISSLEPIRSLSKLFVVNVRNNLITDMSPLLDLPNLREVHLYDNPVNDWSVLSPIKDKLLLYDAP